MVNYPSYESFFNELLSYLYEKFISSARFKDIAAMSSIITCLSELLYNNYKVKSDEPTLTFNDTTEEMESMSDLDLGLAVNAVQHLCKILINVAHGDFRAMLCVMQFYERLNAAENLYKLNSTNVIPAEIFYAFLVNPNIILLDRYAALINNSSLLGQKHELSQNHPGLITIAKQAQELYIFLWRNPMTTSLFQQNLIVRHSILYRKALYMGLRIYVMKHNLAFLHLTRLDTDGNLYDNDRIGVHLTRFKKACPYLMELLSTIKNLIWW